MAKSTGNKSDDGFLPKITDVGAFAAWLQQQPLQWSIVIAVRAALRTLPFSTSDPGIVLPTFRALSIAHFFAKYPDGTINLSYATRATKAAGSADAYTAQAAAFAVETAVEVVSARAARAEASAVYVAATAAVTWALDAAIDEEIAAEMKRAVLHDAERLVTGLMTFDRLASAPLWHVSQSPRITHRWHSLVHALHVAGEHWSVWIKWYADVVAGHRATEREDNAFTDIPGELPWDRGGEAVNVEITRRLEALHPDPAPIEGIISPITINRKPDGRIGVDAGPFSLPTVPAALTPDDHRSALTACFGRAVQLIKLASSPQFQARSEYAQVLSDYLDWLPSEEKMGNMLLADGEARILNKLFTAEESILPTVFASKLSVLLEDHIALRSFYPEIERHYQAVNTGRLVVPLSRDAVQAIQNVIRSQTPVVFDETVLPAIGEATKPVPDITPVLPEHAPPADSSRPKPPNDPIAEADPLKSRSYIIASAYNRIWSILLRGKDTAHAIEGWQKTYNLLKPYIGAVLDFLRHFGPGDGPGGGGPLPPTINV